jgi:hypothetical protein
VSVRLYVEGGGDSKTLRVQCRQGFSEFVRKAGLAGRMPRIVACGGRQDAYDSFRTACTQDSGGGSPMLLVDAEAPVSSAGAWEHLQSRDGWVRPEQVRDDQCHLMVQCMEAWFLADRQAVAAYFGQGFRGGALPGNPQVEDIPKADVLEGLARAAGETTKQGYWKGRHSFELLALIDPTLVGSAAPFARRFLTALRVTPPEP